MSSLRLPKLLLTLLIPGACASAYEMNSGYDDYSPQSSRPLPNQLVGSVLPGQLVQPLPGQIVPLLPGQVVQPLRGQIIGALPGQIVPPLYRQIKNPVLPWAMNLAQPIVPPPPPAKTKTASR